MKRTVSRPTPWGMTTSVQELIQYDVYWVSTPSHGGLMISAAWAESNLSPEAIACGYRSGLNLFYEEDELAAVPAYECEAIRNALDWALDDITSSVNRIIPYALANRIIPYALAKGINPHSSELNAYKRTIYQPQRNCIYTQRQKTIAIAERIGQALPNEDPYTFTDYDYFSREYDEYMSYNGDIRYDPKTNRLWATVIELNEDNEEVSRFEVSVSAAIAN